MPYVSDLLTAAAASVTGTPTPTRSWQWLRGSTLISGATSSTYTVAEDDIGSAISVRQIESNIAGVATATSAATAAVQAFDPIALFQNSEEGAWYDPSDLSTLYQDSAGTTPVTAAGQPVGLMLDKSKGLTLGSELVTNGTFDTDISGWSTHGGGAALSWNAGRLLCSTTSSFNGAKQAITTVAGRTYFASITVYPNGSSELRIGAGDGANLSNIQLFVESPSVAKTYSFHFKALSSTTTVSVTAGNLPVTGSFEVDNVTVKELPGNHATQSTSTARPTLAVTGTTPATLGSNVVVNGTFDTATDWATGADWTIASGYAENTTGGTGLMQPSAASLTVGKSYQIDFDLVATAGRTIFRPNAGAAAGQVEYNTTGSKTLVFEATAQFFAFRELSGSAGTIVDNVVIKEVLTWADPKYYLDFDGVDDRLATAVFASELSQPNTLAFAYKQDINGNFSIIDSAILQTNSRHLFRNNVGQLQVYAGAVVNSQETPSTADKVALLHFNTSNSSCRFNGVTTASSIDVGSFTWGSLGLMSTYVPSSYQDGRIYGFVGVNRTLTTAEIEATESYLADKSGVTLP